MFLVQKPLKLIFQIPNVWISRTWSYFFRMNENFIQQMFTRMDDFSPIFCCPIYRMLSNIVNYWIGTWPQCRYLIGGLLLKYNKCIAVGFPYKFPPCFRCNQAMGNVIRNMVCGKRREVVFYSLTIRFIAIFFSASSIFDDLFCLITLFVITSPD